MNAVVTPQILWLSRHVGKNHGYHNQHRTGGTTVSAKHAAGFVLNADVPARVSVVRVLLCTKHIGDMSHQIATSNSKDEEEIPPPERPPSPPLHTTFAARGLHVRTPLAALFLE